ncbi:hypothetical protein ADUPG1_008509 [Aduncisulcus paluster]|uniref:Uncharacterized protein n=1 Tax=Aduncisulcus paluster TaxID=2918883 RepID=A0ABQ5KS87_9EUKA|nr:hypothetical protein ADUPG1_008509 [Aduncisulcus paluster]
MPQYDDDNGIYRAVELVFWFTCPDCAYSWELQEETRRRYLKFRRSQTERRLEVRETLRKEMERNLKVREEEREMRRKHAEERGEYFDTQGEDDAEQREREEEKERQLERLRKEQDEEQKREREWKREERERHAQYEADIRASVEEEEEEEEEVQAEEEESSGLFERPDPTPEPSVEEQKEEPENSDDEDKSESEPEVVIDASLPFNVTPHPSDMFWGLDAEDILDMTPFCVSTLFFSVKDEVGGTSSVGEILSILQPYLAAKYPIATTQRGDLRIEKLEAERDIEDKMRQDKIHANARAREQGLDREEEGKDADDGELMSQLDDKRIIIPHRISSSLEHKSPKDTHKQECFCMLCSSSFISLPNRKPHCVGCHSASFFSSPSPCKISGVRIIDPSEWIETEEMDGRLNGRKQRVEEEIRRLEFRSKRKWLRMREKQAKEWKDIEVEEKEKRKLMLSVQKEKALIEWKKRDEEHKAKIEREDAEEKEKQLKLNEELRRQLNVSEITMRDVICKRKRMLLPSYPEPPLPSQESKKWHDLTFQIECESIFKQSYGEDPDYESAVKEYEAGATSSLVVQHLSHAERYKFIISRPHSLPYVADSDRDFKFNLLSLATNMLNSKRDGVCVSDPICLKRAIQTAQPVSLTLVDAGLEREQMKEKMREILEKEAQKQLIGEETETLKAGEIEERVKQQLEEEMRKKDEEDEMFDFNVDAELEDSEYDDSVLENVRVFTDDEAAKRKKEEEQEKKQKELQQREQEEKEDLEKYLEEAEKEDQKLDNTVVKSLQNALGSALSQLTGFSTMDDREEWSEDELGPMAIAAAAAVVAVADRATLRNVAENLNGAKSVSKYGVSVDREDALATTIPEKERSKYLSYTSRFNEHMEGMFCRKLFSTITERLLGFWRVSVNFYDDPHSTEIRYGGIILSTDKIYQVEDPHRNDIFKPYNEKSYLKKINTWSLSQLSQMVVILRGQGIRFEFGTACPPLIVLTRDATTTEEIEGVFRSAINLFYSKEIGKDISAHFHVETETIAFNREVDRAISGYFKELDVMSMASGSAVSGSLSASKVNIVSLSMVYIPISASHPTVRSIFLEHESFQGPEDIEVVNRVVMVSERRIFLMSVDYTRFPSCAQWKTVTTPIFSIERCHLVEEFLKAQITEKERPICFLLFHSPTLGLVSWQLMFDSWRHRYRFLHALRDALGHRFVLEAM